MAYLTARKEDVVRALGGPDGINSLAVFSYEPGNSPFHFKPFEIGECLIQPRSRHRVWQVSALLLGLSLRSYYVRELLTCWLFLCFVLALVALVIVGCVLIGYAGKSIVQRVSMAKPLAPVVALGSGELRLEIMPIPQDLK
jgi:hypothetical protein